MYKNLTYHLENGVATVGLNRPEALNSLNLPLLQELAECLTRCGDDPGIRAVILKGEGKVFCAGGDIKSMEKEPSRSFLLRQLTLYLHTAISAIWRMPKPVIAAVHGSVTGAAFALALSCDVIIAAEKTRFGTAYLAIGLSPDGGTTFFLPKVLGLHRAKYLTFTSEMIDAQVGHQMGFIGQVVKGEDLLTEVMKMANKLAAGPALAIAKSKELLNQSFTQTLETQMGSERDGISFASGTDDFAEGLNAFFGKRSPRFKRS
jgi:2-(1,2-epoxy-1,2-dihydrophenyl)acetyl-CoA isomerase